jgi:hypothetical protein
MNWCIVTTRNQLESQSRSSEARRRALALSRPYFAAHVIEECQPVDAPLGIMAESVLLTNAQTGPFNRTSGQPSPKYLSMKERSETLGDLFSQGSSGNRVFSRLREAAVEMLNRERLDDEQMGFE